ncbi:MAG: hypothetical protein JXA52_09485 [Planctomycetes bacterium]|nr:hypothetical protein [Planctomycetota bacterium]
MSGIHSSTAFTMVEVMVSVTVVGLMVALLLPVFSDAHESAYALECMNNMRTIGFGSEQYCEEFFEMPANVITVITDPTITSRNFNSSYFLSYEGEVTGAGVMVRTRHIPLAAMYCLNAKGTYVQLDETRYLFVERLATTSLSSRTAISSYVKAGRNMLVPDPRGGEFNIGINPRFSQNQKKPVFTELMANHSDGVNALFGDCHIEFVKIRKQPDWIEGDPRIFEELLNQRGLEITDIPEERQVNPEDFF